ncbi:YbhB/YbcL family Raf kinase inhibitor-like protein [Streptococcus thoraltensis]
MKINHYFENNTLPDLYSKYTDKPVDGFSATSFPFEIIDLPENTVSLAWTFTDIDAIPVCGFEYIHWVVANASPEKTKIAEDFASQDKEHLKGSNSLTSKFMDKDFGDLSKTYIGPCPPDKDHLYTLTAYALDKELDLKEGFFLNELRHAMNGHILAQASHDFVGRS